MNRNRYIELVEELVKFFEVNTDAFKAVSKLAERIENLENHGRVQGQSICKLQDSNLKLTLENADLKKKLEMKELMTKENELKYAAIMAVVNGRGLQISKTENFHKAMSEVTITTDLSFEKQRRSWD